MSINDTFRALADPTRREILRMLRDGDMTAGEIAERFDLSRSTLSGHFNVLKAAGLIVSERNRTTIVYSINMSASEEAVGAVLGLLRREGEERSDGSKTTRSSVTGSPGRRVTGKEH